MFILRNLLGIRQRQRSKWAVFLTGAGLFSCIGAALMAAIFVPANLANGWRSAALARPTPSELRKLPAGIKVLVAAQISASADADEATQGLALFYVERTESVGDSKIKRSRDPETKTVRERDVAAQFGLTLGDGAILQVRVPAQTTLSHPQRIRLREDPSEVPGLRIERTYVGYLPGQSLTVEGIWEGDGLTASEFFAGSIDDYVHEVQVIRPLQLLYTALCCAGLGVGMVVAGFAIRLLRR